MKILLTGGAGYIGSHAAIALLEGGHKVTVIDNLSTGNKKLIPFGNLVIGSSEKVIALKTFLIPFLQYS